MKTSWHAPEFQKLEGKFVDLHPYDVVHGEALYQASHSSPENESVWNYLFYGPFQSAKELTGWYRDLSAHKDPLIWTAVLKESGLPVGITSLLNIVPEHGRAEIGHVWFSPAVHRTAVNTESQYLLLKLLFGDLNYRRVEWKCDSLNEPSRNTAQRMGFSYEGRFRQHMMVKGKNRDTDWFSITDLEWPARKQNFERWLYSGEKLSLAQLNRVS